MANEVKSEIRDVVSAVDVFITPDNTQLTYSRSSISSDSKISPPRLDANQDNDKSYTPGSSSDTVINLISSPTVAAKQEEDQSDSNKGKTKVLSTSTVASVSSQDR